MLSRSAAGLALVVSLAILGVAHADPPAASSGSTAAPSPRERLTGRFTFVGGEKQVAAKDAAIEKSTESMFFAIRGMARSKLREVTAVSPSVAIAFANGSVTITTADSPPATSPESGATVAWKNREGKTVQLAQKLTADGSLTQTTSTSEGGRTTTFVLSADAKTLTVTHVITAGKLPQPIRYSLTYHRA